MKRTVYHSNHFKALTLLCFIMTGLAGFAQNPGLIISEFFANPSGADSCKEYVELIATKDINFGTDPYTVIWCNNGSATSKGWVAGGNLTYAFSLSTGSVSKGDVVYVGGNCMAPAGTRLRVIATHKVNGDAGIGNFNSSGVMGNGGANADGIAVFNKSITSIDSSTVPVDAVFYGTGIGTALVSSGSKGYQLPVNDLYTGGKLQSGSFIAGDPASDVIVTAAGEYNPAAAQWVTGRTWTSGSTPTNGTSSVKVKQTVISASKYTWKDPDVLGSFQGKTIRNGGFSGLHFDRKTSQFITITDRGPNLDAENNKHAISIGGAGNGAKLFPLPAFSPQIMTFRVDGDSLKIVSSATLKKPDGIAASGLTNPLKGGGTGEIALSDTNGTVTLKDIWGIDSEGITEGNDNDYWICEEYGTSVWHTDKNGKVLNRYVPFSVKQSQDISIDSIFSYRNPNKGFEGVAFTPDNKVYTFIQNTILFPASDANLKKNTRLHRFIEIDPKTGSTRMLGYEHLSNAVYPSIKHDKRYIGDAVAVNDHQLLVLEHGTSATESYAHVYLVELNGATAISANGLAYGGGTKSFEQLLDSAAAAAAGVTCVKKTLVLDLIAAGYSNTIEKEEGLAILNDSTIAVANDNDFGVVSTNSDGVMSYNNVKSEIFVTRLSKKLDLCDVVSITAAKTAVCPGDSVQLSTQSVNGISYRWYKDNVQVPGTAASYYVKAAGAYELRATNAKGCVAVSNTKTISLNPAPAVPVVSQSKDTLIATGTGTFQWYFNNSKINNATARKYKFTQNGSYYVVITDANGCTSKSAAYSAQLSAIDMSTFSEAVAVYPNPFNDKLSISIQNPSVANVTVSIYSVQGAHILTENKETASVMEISTANLPQGVYLLQISSGKAVATQRLIKL